MSFIFLFMILSTNGLVQQFHVLAKCVSYMEFPYIPRVTSLEAIPRMLNDESYARRLYTSYAFRNITWRPKRDIPIFYLFDGRLIKDIRG